ncbi:hypothetical protein CRE_10713, partial [Caenorhabditis remanei]
MSFEKSRFTRADPGRADRAGPGRAGPNCETEVGFGYHNNLNLKCRTALATLSENKKYHYSVSDKGGEFVVATRDLYEAAMVKHLSDNSTYGKISKRDYTNNYKALQTDIDQVYYFWDPKTVRRLADNHPAINTIYGLFKTHKFTQRGVDATNDNVKIRPIISGSGGPTDRPSWVVSTILSQLTKFVGAHLENTAHLLTDLNRVKAKGEIHYESFDVESLYTNIHNQSALEAVKRKLHRHGRQIEWYGISSGHLIQLLEAVIRFNSFQFAGTFYIQKRGLAMGSRLAPVLAVIYMDTIETPSNVYPTLLYRRYIDDIFVIAESKTTLDDVFLSLNSQADTIRLTRETPTEGWLPFLNCEIRHKNDAFSTRWYRKPSNKNILIRFDSCQPKQHKINTIRTTQRTAVANSTFDNIKYSKDLAENILRKNGYLTTVKGVPY